MAANKSLFNRTLAVLSALLILYFFAEVAGSAMLDEILSPLNAYACAAAVFLAFLKDDRRSKLRFAQLLSALSCFAWGVGDTVWAFLISSGADPSKSVLDSIIYMLPGLMMAASLFIFASHQFRKWNYIQLFVDILIIGFICLFFIYIVYFHKSFSLLGALLEKDYTTIPCILCDILVLICILSWALSIRSGALPISLVIMALGTGMFVLNDLLYYYVYFKFLYIPNSATDFIYILSFFLIAVGAMQKLCFGPRTFDFTVITNKGHKKNWIYLTIFPLSAIVLKNLSNLPLSIEDIFLFAFVIFLYAAACKYVQLSIENERLLENEKLANGILEQRVERQKSKLSFLENQDPLTALFNRRYFISCLDSAASACCESSRLAVLLLDIDRFKAVNESFGHDAGDKVLIEFADRLVIWNRYGALIARLSGDEFAILMKGKYERKDIEGFCREIIEICSLPVNLGFETLKITASVGAVLCSPGTSTGRDLLNCADVALYRAKQHGYGKYEFFDPFFTRQVNKSNELVRLLRKADAEKDFVLFYQPQFSLPGLELIGAEALIRWRTAKHGYILPGEFIPIAEETGCISDIGKWVMTESVRQSTEWNSKFGAQLKISFNVSVKQLVEDSFAEALKESAVQKGFTAAWVDAEITESFMILGKDKVRDLFALFEKLGISVSIDDFGSGYSSYAYLREFRFDRIKIDKSLIDGLSRQNQVAVNVLNAIISMAKAVGVKTLAEGVETKEQLEILTELGCDQIQGFLLGRPVPPEIFEARYISSGIIMKRTADI